jgi:hypothetical protein
LGPLHPHVVLLRLVTREHRYALRSTEFARKNSTDKSLAERPRAACDENPSAFKGTNGTSGQLVPLSADIA